MSILLQHLLHSEIPCAIFSRRMMHASKISDHPAPAQIKVDGVEIRLVRLPLLEPFETSFGKIDSRLIFLICLDAGGLKGWGEVVASEQPLYSYETVGTAFHIIKDFLAPAVLDEPITDLAGLARRLSPFRGHNMAKAGLELAFMDLLAQVNKQSLATLIGGERKRIAVGVSLGIQPTVSQLLKRVERYLSLGYQRIKLKIKPGWDIDVVFEVRRLYPDILLSVDANSAYTLADVDHLRRLDEFDLLMIEQPLHHEDLVRHAALGVVEPLLDELLHRLHAVLADQILQPALADARRANHRQVVAVPLVRDADAQPTHPQEIVDVLIVDLDLRRVKEQCSLFVHVLCRREVCRRLGVPAVGLVRLCEYRKPVVAVIVDHWDQ